MRFPHALAHPVATLSWKGVYMAARRISAILTLSLAIFAALLVAPGGGHRLMAADDSAVHGFDVANLDRTCKPCDDFHQFAVGGWLKNNPIPAQYPVWGSFITLADKNQEALRGILESAAANRSATAGSNEQKIGDFYASCMDSKEIDAQALKPIGPELLPIQASHHPRSFLPTH